MVVRERERERERVKMWICEDVKMWRWADVKMSRSEDEKMWRWADVKMSRCEDEKVWRWENVKMRRCERRCEDEKVWRWEDEIQTPTIGRTLRSDALGKKHGRNPTTWNWCGDALIWLVESAPLFPWSHAGYVIPLWRLLVMGEGNIAFHYRIDESRLINLFHWLINSADHHIFYQNTLIFRCQSHDFSHASNGGSCACRAPPSSTFVFQARSDFFGWPIETTKAGSNGPFFGRTQYFGQSFFWSH